jgi:glutaredoxin
MTDTQGAVIYTKDNCSFCVKAKQLLKKHKIEIIEEIDALKNREALVESVTKETGVAPRTVPQIWLNGEYVGGYKELTEKLGS